MRFMFHVEAKTFHVSFLDILPERIRTKVQSNVGFGGREIPGLCHGTFAFCFGGKTAYQCSV